MGAESKETGTLGRLSAVLSGDLTIKSWSLAMDASKDDLRFEGK